MADTRCEEDTGMGDRVTNKRQTNKKRQQNGQQRTSAANIKHLILLPLLILESENGFPFALHPKKHVCPGSDCGSLSQPGRVGGRRFTKAEKALTARYCFLDLGLPHEPATKVCKTRPP